MKRLFTFVICLALSHFSQATGITKPKADSNIVTAKRDTLFTPVVNPVAYTPYQNVFKRRLDSIQKEVPLNYNEYVQSYIDIYTSGNRKSDIGRMLGLCKYYFPIYEKAFREAGIPEEIKFLSIVESELNPNATSRVGAAGPWQFMAATGKTYGLNINDDVDERRDPIKASYAAAAYLKDAYMEFGDWLLAIASYNCGKSSVERAIDKAGATDFWAIRQYLPQETRGYVPAYIAVSYVMNYYNKHGIMPQACSFNPKTDTVIVNKTISLSGLARLLDVDYREVALLNPSYKRGVITASATAPRRLVLPQVRANKFSLLYDALNNDVPVTYTQPPVVYAANTERTQPVKTPAYHIVKRGETLAYIADIAGVEVQDLKDWNNLRGNKAVVGKRLRLSENTGSEEPATETKATAKKYVIYKVRKGDTLSTVADKFEASMDEIKELNGLKQSKLQPGMTLKINKV
ncbi:lytic transglycosylase domain-containing protein [Mucilaginibacter boryungensis]|uniref:Transglycosylase SLT domain-containing protein n=1 Tax=Mucilaginibacter boryungensis TaxID=768480 RepID=A0ABR9XBP9_9SPHI|nr:lytic transglycosylase domain-containing protein [Mucilaginibacter boryungensis]MBE9664772.1 transglycosylase SLT domain-containing protein [Mucilaginibacter boryungensis]